MPVFSSFLYLLWSCWRAGAFTLSLRPLRVSVRCRPLFSVPCPYGPGISHRNRGHGVTERLSETMVVSMGSEPCLALPAGWLWVSYSPSCCQSCLLCKHSCDCSSQTSQGRSCIKWVVSAQCWGPCPGHGEARCGRPFCECASFILRCRSFFHLLISPNRVCLSVSRCLIGSDFSFLVPHGTVMHLISDIVIQWRDTVLLFSVQ